MNPSEIDHKWQEFWRQKDVYKVEDDTSKPKCYVLDMFPYPSGAGLHVGHPKGYIATDVYSRYKRMQGFNVLHPMGWDAFGLPAENYAIKNKVHPSEAVDKNVVVFKEQLNKIGFNFDWSREINTTDPKFYKWTQWAVAKMFEAGLMEEVTEPILWCPTCKTGLAMEDLEGDKCERCSTVVERKPLRQWLIKITKYADRMLEDLDSLDWNDSVKAMQRHWIGRSEGAKITFAIKDSKEVIEVFTTRPDTLFGATYMVLAPEHKLVKALDDSINNKNEVQTYIEDAAKKSDIDRSAEGKEKTGIKLEGIIAINPVNEEEIPVYIADYVLPGYGTGAIMAVPAHDERDYEFAQKFNVSVRQVIAPHFESKTKEGVETLVRDVVDLIIEHPTDGTFLIQKEQDGDHEHRHFVGGGTEGELDKIAIERELVEETGYTDFEITSYVTTLSTLGYRHTKDKNQSTRGNFYHIKLNSLNQVTSEIDEGQHSIEWLKKEDIAPSITWANHLHAWNVFLGNKFHNEAGTLMNSGKFDRMESEEAKKAITEFVGGELTVNYRLQDWVFARQRYWGEPFPFVHKKDGTVEVVDLDKLPVELPNVKNYEPSGTGESPLATIDDWVNLPNGDTRETNTMPQWAGSSWYYLRYLDPQNNEALVDPVKEKYWMGDKGVDLYVGGAEHATRHLIYARFWHKFLYDQGVVSTKEPFNKLINVGLIQAEDGRKMSKRWGNVINPDDVIDQYGADAFRLYEMFMGPFTQAVNWSTQGVEGVSKFLKKYINLFEKEMTDEEPADQMNILHKTIKKVGNDIENFAFNTAVSQMMILVNELRAADKVSRHALRELTLIIAPFAPHLAEEIMHTHFGMSMEESVVNTQWPSFDEAHCKDDEVTIVVQINGKVRGEFTASPDISSEEAITTAKATENVLKYLDGATIRKEIYVPGKLVSLVVA
jgi:leucyl-tRNA synthetase